MFMDHPFSDHLRSIFLKSYILYMLQLLIDGATTRRSCFEFLYLSNSQSYLALWSNSAIIVIQTWLSYHRNEITEISGSNFHPFALHRSSFLQLYHPKKDGSTREANVDNIIQTNKPSIEMLAHRCTSFWRIFVLAGLITIRLQQV